MNKPTAMTQALSLLSRKARTTTEMVAALKKKEYEPAEISEAVARCLEYGYLNDERYGQQMAADLSRLKKVGNSTIAFKLKRKGIDDKTIEIILSNMKSNEDIPAEPQRALELLQRRFRTPLPAQRDKAIRFLRSRGFNWDIISAALRQHFSADAAENASLLF